MRKSKYVTDWFITKDPNGVYTLVINTTQRYCYAFHIGDGLFQISSDSDEQEEVFLEVPEFLPAIEGHYLEAHAVHKDQIHFYFIPYLYEWHKKEGKNFVLTSREL